MATLYTSTSVDTTLTATLGAGATTCTVADATALLGGLTISGGNTMTLAIDPDTASEEIVILTNVSGSTLTITRAQGGTTDINHSSGATVRHVLTSIELTAFATKAAAETLTNKTVALGSNTVSGTTAQFNTALTDNDFATLAGTETLTNKTIALGSNTVSGTLAQFNTAITDNDINPANLPINAQTGTTYTLILADSTKLVTLDNAVAITVTVPANSSVAYPTGTQINLLQKGVGQVTVAGAVGVTVNATPGLKIRSQWGAGTLIKIDTDTWVLLGDLVA